MESHALSNDANAANITESVTDAVLCDADGFIEPVIESKDVVDVPEITITLADSRENLCTDNSLECDAPSIDEVAANDVADDLDTATKHLDDVIEQNGAVSNIIVENKTIEINVENFEQSEPIETGENDVTASPSIEIENNKMADSQKLVNGENTDECDESVAVESTANTTDEGISMENSNNHQDQTGATATEISLNMTDASITSETPNTDKGAVATNETIVTDAGEKATKSPRRKSNKTRKSKAKAKAKTQEPSAVEMATDADVYEVIVTPRQRQYQLMVKNPQQSIPADNCEIFCNNIPINVLEAELIPLFDRYGKIWNLRLLMSPLNARRNAGFAFVRYTSSVAAQDAVKNLTNYEILPGKMLAVRPSQPNLSLFVGNINRNQTKEQLHTIFTRLTKGLIKTVVKGSYYEENKNCGFCFLEYESHVAALTARLTLKRSRVWGRQLFVDWSQRRTENEANGSRENKTLFIDNLPKKTTDDEIKSKLLPFGEIDGITIVKDYAFVEFRKHDSIVAVLNGFNAKEAFGTDETELSFAVKRPQRNRNAFARHSKMFLGRSYGSRPRLHQPRAFKTRLGSTARLVVPVEKPQQDQAITSAAAIQIEQAEEKVPDVQQEVHLEKGTSATE